MLITSTYLPLLEVIQPYKHLDIQVGYCLETKLFQACEELCFTLAA